ncbi:hypothetical protein BC834DRAFT_388124 [Gloeopeniophorella convolvens]|nr:hypothetical protein BC834DRAFT_388124 [Gloeopeniophorella convolvens]
MEGGPAAERVIMLTQNPVDVLGPGIIGLFTHGVTLSFVISQFTTFSIHAEHERREVVLLAIFVTAVALVQTGVYFAGVWRLYVMHFGGHPVFTTLMAAPVQAFCIWRCWPILKRSRYVIALFAFLLIGSIVNPLVLSAHFFQLGPASSATPLYPPFILSTLFPATLDTALTGVLLARLMKSLKQVYTVHVRRRIVRLIAVGWRAVVPPTVCAILHVIIYLLFTIKWPEKRQFWFIAIQSAIGKLYVISLFFNLNSRKAITQELLPTHMSTLTSPVGEGITLTQTHDPTSTCGAAKYTSNQSGQDLATPARPSSTVEVSGSVSGLDSLK